MDATKLAEAIQALRAGEDRAHGDALVARALGHKVSDRNARYTGEYAPSIEYTSGPYQGMQEPVPQWTCNLHAATVIIRQTLPEFEFAIAGGGKIAEHVALSGPVRGEIRRYPVDAPGGNLARPLVLALLLAIQDGALG